MITHVRKYLAAMSIIALVVSIVGVGVHALSYFRCVSLTLFDAQLSIDEGLLSIVLPLVPLAEGQTPSVELMVYEREQGGWTSGNSGRTPLRYRIERLINNGFPGKSAGGFGYYKGGWLNDARPGAWIDVFVPVWFVSLLAFGGFSGGYLLRFKFGMRSLLIATTLFGIAMGFLILYI